MGGIDPEEPTRTPAWRGRGPLPVDGEMAEEAGLRSVDGDDVADAAVELRELSADGAGAAVRTGPGPDAASSGPTLRQLRNHSGAPAPLLVTDAAGLAGVLERLGRVERYALDTEFHRERTYRPRVALVQVAWPAVGAEPAGVALIDAQAVDIGPLAQVLAGPATMVAHAAEQDLEVLRLACGRGPSRLLDTQVAAGFAGAGTASLSTLSSAYLGLAIPKGDRLTDWSARPLTASQLRYAASDVDHLLELAERVEAELVVRGRLAWAEEECELLRRRALAEPDPTIAWWKLRDSRQLRGSSRGVAQEVAAWREERAARLDIPARHVLPDLALQAISHRPPASLDALRAVRGIEPRHLRAGAGSQVLAAVERGLRLPADQLRLPPADEVPRDLRPAVSLAMAWTAQLSKDIAVDAALLATRADMVALLRSEPASRLVNGWRAEVVGRPLRKLLAGDAALAFDGKGGLVIEARSHRELGD